MAITTTAGVRTAARKRRHIGFAAMATNAGAFAAASAWATGRGWLPAGAIPPAAGEIPTKATLGAVPFANPGSGKSLYCGGLTMPVLDAFSLGGTLVLYDRLWHCGALSGTVTTAQTVTSVAINRGDTTGDNVQIWIEIYSTIGGTSVTFTVSYTNQDNTAGRSATAAYTSTYNQANGMFRCLLEGTDTGVRSVESVTLSASTTGAGNFGMTLVRPIAWAASDTQALAYPTDALSFGLAPIAADACLAFQIVTARVVNNGNTQATVGDLLILEG